MPVRIVFDYPGRQISSSLGRFIARIIGAVLVFIGLLATVVAIPAGFVTIGDIINQFQSKPEDLFGADFPLRQVELAFVAAVTLAWAGLRYGRALIRGRRSVVLFLRRFGYRGSMQAVTFAVANTIGVAWRLTTLDDQEMAPIGVDGTSRFLFGAGERFARVVAVLSRWVLVTFQWTIGGMWAVVALQVVVAWPNLRGLLTDGTADKYVRVFASIMEARIPWRYFEPTLSGVFAVLMTAAAVAFGGLMIGFFGLLAALPLFGFVMMATSSAEALKKAEGEKTQAISTVREIRDVVGRVARGARQTFAPRLVVVRVASSIWQPTVTAFAEVASTSIVDISEPTLNLAWELGELERLCPGRCILIGDHERVTKWAEGADERYSEDALERRMATLLGDRAVLAYTTDRRGMRRFARALYGMLLDPPAEGVTPSAGGRSPQAVLLGPDAATLPADRQPTLPGL